MKKRKLEIAFFLLFLVYLFFIQYWLKCFLLFLFLFQKKKMRTAACKLRFGRSLQGNFEAAPSAANREERTEGLGCLIPVYKERDGKKRGRGIDSRKWGEDRKERKTEEEVWSRGLRVCDGGLRKEWAEGKEQKARAYRGRGEATASEGGVDGGKRNWATEGEARVTVATWKK